MSTVDATLAKTLHEKFWDWIFTTEDGEDTHPLKVSNGGEAQKQVGKLLVLAGSLQGAGSKKRSLRIPPDVESIFVPVDNALCTLADHDGQSDQDLTKKANDDISGARGKVWFKVDDGQRQDPDLLDPHLFSLDIQKVIKGTGKEKNGEGTLPNGDPPRQTTAGASCYFVVIPAKSLRSKIQIVGRDIDVTYTLT